MVMISEKKSRKARKTGVICNTNFQSCHVLHLLLLISYPNNHKTNKHENLHVYIFYFLACALSGYIFVNPFASCVTDRYLPQQYTAMQTI